tara:strand:+ start:673 stop:1776 length:1104 start_codon:yes stop_codon:yes gene_type:complete
MSNHGKSIAPFPIASIRAFVGSPEFTNIPDESLSDYWRHHHEKITFDFDTGLGVAGESGVYTPRRTRNIFQKLGWWISSPRTNTAIIWDTLLHRLIAKSGLAFEMVPVPADLAFDAVMSAHPAVDPVPSPLHVDFKDVAARAGAFVNHEAVDRDYRALSNGIPTNDYVLLSYYYMNLLNHFGVLEGGVRFLEIGAGNGNLSALLLRHRRGPCFIVDLPRTLTASIVHLSQLYPDLNFVLPHEAASTDFTGADLVFLTPAQIDLIPDHACDLTVNTHSFQEMTPPQIAAYFALIDRVVAPGGHFFTVNRAEKIPVGAEEPNSSSPAEVVRFADYPWNPAWSDLAYQICPMGRLLGRDNWFLRLRRKPQ